MLSPEQVGLCRMCHKVVSRFAGGSVIGSHIDVQECVAAKSLVEYIDQYVSQQVDWAKDYWEQAISEPLPTYGEF